VTNFFVSFFIVVVRVEYGQMPKHYQVMWNLIMLFFVRKICLGHSCYYCNVHRSARQLLILRCVYYVQAPSYKYFRSLLVFEHMCWSFHILAMTVCSARWFSVMLCVLLLLSIL